MKYISQFIPLLQDRLQLPLPGLNAQMDMAPSIRGREWIIPDNARKSAVLILLYPHEGNYFLAFMKRAEDGRVHSGQVCFPGGRREDSDRDYIHTALRETEEELGVAAEQIEILGALTELYIPPSNSLVFPKVGFCSSRPQFTPDAHEVAKIIEVPLGQFLDKDIVDFHRVDVHGGNYIQAPGYMIEGHLIWGATAMMIAELMSLVREVQQDASSSVQ